MDRLRAVAICTVIVALGAAGQRLFAMRATAPRTLAPLVEEALVAPPQEIAPEPGPPRDDVPDELAIDFVRRLLERVRAAAGARDRVEAQVVRALDAEAFARSSLGGVWASLSEPQRAVAARDLAALAVRATTRGAAAWLAGDPRVTAVKEEGASARVTTRTRDGRDEIEVVLVMSRGPAGWRVVDVVTEDVSAARAYRSQLERLFARNGGDPAPLLAKIAAKVGRADRPSDDE